MKRNTSVVLSATFALPLLTGITAQPAPANDSPVSGLSAATRLTAAEMDAVTAGAFSALPLLPHRYPICEPIVRPPVATTLAIGEEGGYYPYPVVLEPIPEPPILTTMALGEEGGGFGSGI